jgi:hypothetical protein
MSTVLIKLGLTSSLLIMLIILKSRSERKEFSCLQWFWSSFSNFYGIEMPRFHKISFPNRSLRACIETPGFQIPTGRFCAAFLYNARPPTFYELISI